MYLNNWDEYVHDDPEQITRKNRAENEAMKVIALDCEKMAGEVRAADLSTVYHVSTTGCTCKDFEKRGLPCKHMYLLDAALEKALVRSKKSKAVALILAIVLGWAGVHRFYAGKVGTGILWLLTCGMFCFGWVVDIVKIARGRFTDGHGHIIDRPAA